MIIIMKSTKLVLLASIKNVVLTQTPQNITFPGLSVLGNKRYWEQRRQHVASSQGR